jgi:hypothetical protein
MGCSRFRVASARTAVAICGLLAGVAAPPDARGQCPAPLPCNAATAEHTVCLDPDYDLVDGSEPDLEREEDQSSSATVLVLSTHPRVSGSSEAAAGFLALRADSTLVDNSPAMVGAEINVEAHWRRPILIQSFSPTALTGTMIGLFHWEGGLEQNSAPLTTQGDIPLNGTRTAALLRAGAQDETCQNEIAAVERFDSLCTGRRELEAGPCTGADDVDELFQIEIPFTFGVPFQLFAFARLETDVVNLDDSIADAWFGGARAKFDGTGRWMGILEVRDFLGAPLADWTVTDLAHGDVDWARPVPEPGASASLATLIATLSLLRGRRRARLALGVATLLGSPTAAQALVTISAHYEPTASQLAVLQGLDVSAEGCDASPPPLGCFFDHAELGSFPLAQNPTGDFSFERSTATFEAELDQGYDVLWSFEDTPLGETLAGGSVSITTAARVIAGASSGTGLDGTLVLGQIEVRWVLDVSAPVFLFLFGSAALAGGPVEPRLVFGGLTQIPCLSSCSAYAVQPVVRVSGNGVYFEFAPDQEAAITGSFTSGELHLEPGSYAFSVRAGSANGAPVVLGAPETQLVQEELGLDFAIVPVPEPRAGAALVAAVAALLLLRPGRSTRIGVVVAATVAAGAANAAVYWVPGFEDTPDFQTASFGAVDEVGWMCPTPLCTWTGSDSVNANLEVGPPFFGERFGETWLDVPTPSTNGWVVGHTWYNVEWDKDAPSHLYGHASVYAELNLMLTPIPDEFPEAELYAYGEVRASARLCFEVSDVPVTLRLWGTASPPTSDLHLGDSEIDQSVVKLDFADWVFISTAQTSSYFDSGPLLVEPGAIECMRGAVYADEVAISNTLLGWDIPPVENASITIYFEILPVPEPGAGVALAAAAAALVLSHARSSRHRR